MQNSLIVFQSKFKWNQYDWRVDAGHSRTELTQEDIELLQAPQVGGMILFARNIESPQQVRALTDHMRQVRPDILIAVDQEGGRVQRLKSGFTLLPAMGRFGELYITQPQKHLN